MADTIVPSFDGDEDLEEVIAAELSKNDDLVDYIQENSLDALKARFGAAEEDARIRNSGFELAKKGGLIKKPKPENVIVPYGAEHIRKSEDIQTQADSELAEVFDSTKSGYDSTTVEFEDLGLNKKPEKKEVKTETQTETKPEPKAKEPPKEEPPAPPKRKRGRPRKNPLPPEPVEEKKEEKTASDDEEYQLVKKYNTHTKVIFVDEYIDDGIKRNSESELENLFNGSSDERRRKLWSPRKK